ncbi:MAG TPA: methyl-accepting chemotaxis protein [Cellulomonadaceae bacterium]|nr:methyl-accepting chemotaxis protein [Cellulomonadaceae bacterium]
MLRRVRVAVRLTAGFLVVALCAVALWGVALTSASGTRTAAANLSVALARVDAAKQVKFRSADFNGWQTAYAFDITRGVVGSTADSAPSRAAYLASAALFTTELNTLADSHLDAKDAALVAEVRTTFADFTATDTEVIADYRTGTVEGMSAANGLVIGKEIQLFQKISDDVDLIVSSAESAAATSTADARSSASRTSTLAAGIGIVSLAGSAILAILLTLSITRPLGTLRARLADIAEGEGDLTKRLEVDGKDEFTEVSRSFNTFVVKIADTVRGISGSASTVAAASEELTAVSTQILATAAQMSAQSEAVAGAAEEVSRNVETAAAGAEEMSASIREIAASASEASRVGDETMVAAQATRALIAKLGDSSREIGDVVKVITSIAAQTNLLALNATIEAARAGDAGRGFAVVAGEVKDLAQETARSTENITARVAGIQSDTAAAVEAINAIVMITGRLGDHQTTIAAAVEQQTATTNEMSRNINQASVKASEIAANVAEIAEAARSTNGGMVDVQQSAQGLSVMSHEVRGLVDQFTV